MSAVLLFGLLPSAFCLRAGVVGSPLMEAGLRTPLLDFFRKGDVARDVRLLAAEGAIAPRPLEQLGLLMLLTADHDPDIRAVAERTLARIPIALLGGCLAASDVPQEMRQFFAGRGVPIGDPATPVTGDLLPDDDASDYEADEAGDLDGASVLQRLAGMSVPEKVKAAIKGTREMRAVLIRDPNKMVAMAVLSSPKISETEVESFARMGSVGEDVLRTIGHTRAWVKSYSVVLALVKNAKTPVALSMNLMPRLNDSDIRRLSLDRNVPESLRMAARKRVTSAER